jgi:hypothetical protein
MARRALISLAAVAALLVSACRRTTHHETQVDVTRVAAVRKDHATGNPLVLDVEFSFTDCPGQQIEVVRGGAEFAACASNHKLADKLSLAIEHKRAPEGVYTWIVRRVGDCTREPDPNDEASYALVRECEDWEVNGARVGFQCRYIPEKKLVEKCPWFRRR